jgi:hypothetical protein
VPTDREDFLAPGKFLSKFELAERSIEDEIAYFLYHAGWGREVGKSYTPADVNARSDAHGVIEIIRRRLPHAAPFVEEQWDW